MAIGRNSNIDKTDVETFSAASYHHKNIDKNVEEPTKQWSIRSSRWRNLLQYRGLVFYTLLMHFWKNYKLYQRRYLLWHLSTGWYGETTYKKSDS
jgi:hypothetical protein